MSKLLQLVVVALFFVQVPFFAEAKTASKAKPQFTTKKSKVSLLKVDSKKMKVSFDAAYYYQLNFKNRKVYLQEIQRLSKDLSRGSSGKRKTAWLDELLFQYAYADQACFDGGIPYRAASCNGLPSDFNITDTSIDGCTATQERCSLMFGLDSGGRVFCYEATNDGRNNATPHCASLSDAVVDGKNGIDRLNERLTRCEFTRSEQTCAALISATTRDTRALDGACASSVTRCNQTKDRIARLHSSIPRAAGETASAPATATATPPVDDGCQAAEQRLAEQMLSQQFDTQNVNKKWLKLIALSGQSCGNGTADLETQLRKFGACTLPSSSTNVEADINNNSNLQSAIAALASRGTSTAPTQAHTAFKDYFGIAPTEFTQLFCNSATTQAFYVGARNLSTPRVAGIPSSDQNSAAYNAEIHRRMRAVLFTTQGFESLRSTMPDSDAKSLLASYYQHQTERQNLTERVNNCNGCADRVARENALNRHVEDYNMQEMRARVERSIPITQEGLRGVLGAANYDSTRQTVISREVGVGGTVAQSTADERLTFQRCVENAISRTEDAGGNNVYTSNVANNSPRVGDRRNQNCSRQLVDNLSTPPRDSRNFLIRIITNDNQNNTCHSTDGNWVGPNVSRLACSKAVRLEPSGNYYCIDNQNSYLAYTYSCRYATGYDLDQTEAERASAAEH